MWKRVALSLALVCASLMLAEGALQVAVRISPAVERLLSGKPAKSAGVPRLLRDERLKVRGNPAWRHHDANGYRNPAVPVRADLVALGDSQTYGVGVGKRENWPAVLAGDTGLTVYNMGVDGYGPAQSELELPRALSLSPDTVVVAVYFGNDLFDAFDMATRHTEIAALVDPELLAEARALEAASPFSRQVGTLFQQAVRGNSGKGTKQSPWPAWVREHVKLYALGRRLMAVGLKKPPSILSARTFSEAAAALTGERLKWASAYDGPEWRTLLTGAYRAPAVDDGDVRIRAGFEVIREVLPRMQRQVEAAGAELLVLLIPTKESVFVPRVSDPEAHVGFSGLVENEARLKAELRARLDAEGIAVVDALGPLVAAVEQPYPVNADGHPNPFGHRVIAGAVAAWLNAGKRGG
ncbi:MAG: GDSL-type esterase/lipase family protein [Leptospirillia bacterium]